MSEYQYYEFKAIDKPLQKEAKSEISKWSSRTVASNTGAIFTYSYGDFPKDEIKVMEKYFDAMFYISNWGSRRLIFKIPNNLINARQLKQYCAEGLEIIEHSDYMLVDIWITDEEGGGGWIEGDGILSSFISLREDIISGDYRCLYLVWLKISTEDVINNWGNVDEKSTEPNVPVGLQSLNGALLDFIEVFEINKDAVAVASEKSKPISTNDNIDNLEALSILTDKEKDEFLTKLLQNEPLLSIKLKNRLKEQNVQTVNSFKNGRSIEEIVKAIGERKEKRKKEDSRKRKEQQLAELKKIEQDESYLWRMVDILIKEKKTLSYEEAIKILLSLKKLAVHKKLTNDFFDRVEIIKQNNYGLSGLKRRINEANLIKKE